MIRKILPALLVASLAPSLRAAPPTPEGVVVLANSADPESLALAAHYLKARAIPEKNLVAFPMPAAEQISWDDFVARVRNPLLKQLAAKGLLEGTVVNTPDREGRIQILTTKNRIDFLVLCRGVPLKIANDPARLLARESTVARQPQFAVNHASVDSELAVLPSPDTPLAGFVANPVYNVAEPDESALRGTLRVARLDGPTAASANKLIDNALEAERTGLLGRAYIDKGGPHPKGDAWLAETAALCAKASFDTTVDESPALIPAGARFDAPAFYFGWYAGDIAGAPADPSFTFPPGAIGLHIHSFSARTLRDPAAGWTGPLVAHGITATVGNVEEPYLELTHNPVLFTAALFSGKTVGEAASFAEPALSWQTVFIGDPLYRPFLHDVPEQLADADRHPDATLAYAVLRGVRRLDAEGENAEADGLLRRAFAKIPVLALAREILDRERKAGKTVSFRTDALAEIREDAGLVTETAEKLVESGKSTEALSLIEKQFSLGTRLNGRAAAIARRFGKTALAAKLAGRG